jgi:aminopeptidase N
MKRIILLVTVLALTLGCSRTNNKTDKTLKVQPKEVKSGIKTADGPYHPSDTRLHDLIHTRLEVKPDWQKQQLNGVATLTLRPYFYPQDTLVLDAKGMDLQSITMVKPGTNALKYVYDGRKIKIAWGKTYTKSDTLTIKIQYTAKPNELPKGGSDAITEDKGLYFINADGSDPLVPKQLWTQGETQSSSCWFPTIDSPTEKTTQEMYITVDTAYTVLSNGEFIYSKKNADGTKTDYWRMDLPHAPYLFMMAVGNFVVTKDKWRDMEVNYYMEPKFAPYARAVFGNTPEMIEFYSIKLGVNYPWPKYSQIVVRDFVSGAMENTSATVHFEGLNADDRQMLDDYWDGIITHELFHHWFGDLVTCESWSNLPLNESFANYSEYMWAEYKYGIDEADRLAQKEEDEYLSEAEEKQEPIIRYHYHDKEDMFDAHSYNKGGRILHMLRKYVGDEAFYKSLNVYLTRKAYQTAEVSDLRMAFEEVTGEDMNWFFNQWFLSPGHPELNITQDYMNGTLTLHISQKQDTSRTPVYRMQVGVDVWVGGIKTTHKIWINKATQDVKIPCPAEPQLVLFDADNVLLAVVKHTKTETELAFQYDHYADRYFARYNALSQLFDLPEGTSKAPTDFNSSTYRRDYLMKAMKDSFWLIRDYSLGQFARYYISNPMSYIKQMEKMALHDAKPSVRARCIYLLSSFNNTQYKYIYERGLNERAYSIVSASLACFIKTGDPSASEKIKVYETSEVPDIVITLAEYYLDQKDLSKFDWFKVKVTHTPDREMYMMTHIFGQYAKLLEGEQRAEARKILMDVSVNNHYEVIRKLAESYAKAL